MPNARSQHSFDADGHCSFCGQQHITARGQRSCEGHVYFDRDSYVPGQPRKRLDQPRPCKRDPRVDGIRCPSHGTRKHAESRRRARQEREALALMTTLGEPINDGRDYAEVIADRVAIRRGHVEWLHKQVKLLEPEALAWGRTKTTRGDVVVGTGNQAQLEVAATDTDEAKPSVWYVLYREAANELEKLCLEAVRVGIEARRLQLDERTADRMVTMIDGIVTALGHDPNAPETAEIVARHLELVA